MAERYLDPGLRARGGGRALRRHPPKIRAIAAETRPRAFDEARRDRPPWTDFRGETHDKMIGRPVAMHAMRGISAHSNGFQTCRALHVLQILLGTVEVPGGFRFKPPYPKPPRRIPSRIARSRPGARSTARIWASAWARGPAARRGRHPARIDKAFTWENPMSAHGLMHMVISNAHAGDPYKIDTLFMYMANMAWNSSMNTRGVIEMLTDKDENGEYVIPRIIYSDAYSSEMVAYADLILPDTTYLERHDCISPARPPDLRGRRRADAIRWPVVEPDRDVRGFQTVLLDLGARLGLPGFVDERTAAATPITPTTSSTTSASPASARWPAGAAKNGDQRGAAPPTPTARPLHRNGGFWCHDPRGGAVLQAVEHGLSGLGGGDGLYDSPQPYPLPALFEPLRRFQLAAEGMATASRPSICATGSRRRFDPLPIWYRRSRTRDDDRGLPAPRAHPAPDGDVSQLGHAERLAAPDPRAQPALRAHQPDLRGAWLAEDGDWAR
jgi:anaerobic selenocysteine-containing dehydrogenase